MKELSLVGRDLLFYLTGKADIALAECEADEWLYPPDWEYQLARESIYFEPKDARGIPVRCYPSVQGEKYLFSRAITYGLANWNRWRRLGSEVSLRKFSNVSDWLLHFGDGRYEHDIAIPGMPENWISCISQGEGASLLSRAYVQTGDVRYLQAAKAAANWLLVPMADGGLLSQLPDGSPFVEEYPGTEYHHVINGCLYALIGLYDVSRICPDETEFANLFYEITKGISQNIDAWDVRGWSRYDFPVDASASPNLNTMTYQVLQTVQLTYIAKVSGEPNLASMAEKWRMGSNSFASRMRALSGKIGYRLRLGW